MDRYYAKNESSENRKCKNSYSEEIYEYKDCYSDSHNHELSASTNYAKDDECRVHNHRIACVTGPAIRSCKTHIHKIETTTDTFCDHSHKVCDTTGPAIYLPNGKHFHIVKGETAKADGHCHEYYLVTALDDQTNVPKSKKC